MGLDMTLSINDPQHRLQHWRIECHYVECRYSECCNYLYVMLSVITLNVVILSVVAPLDEETAGVGNKSLYKCN